MSICWEKWILPTFSDSKDDIFLPLCSEVLGVILIFDVPPEHGSGKRFSLAGVHYWRDPTSDDHNTNRQLNANQHRGEAIQLSLNQGQK